MCRMAYSSDSPQVKAAKVSGENRRRRAAEREARKDRARRYVAEHERGEHEGVCWLGCPTCHAALMEAQGER